MQDCPLQVQLPEWHWYPAKQGSPGESFGVHCELSSLQ